MEPRTLEELSRERQASPVVHEEPPEGGALSILNPPPPEPQAPPAPKVSFAERLRLAFHAVRSLGRNGLIALGAVTFFGGVVVMSDAVKEGYQAFLTAITPPPAPLSVLVTLKNECPYADEAFMVKVLPSGPSAEFIQKRARVMALEGQTVQVVANSRYPGFHYESKWEEAAPEVTLVANCDSPEDRLRATAESIRGSLKK